MDNVNAMKNVAWAVGVNGLGEKIIRRTEENGQVWWVPESPGNSHYEEYLEWLAEGNEPETVEA